MHRRFVNALALAEAECEATAARAVVEGFTLSSVETREKTGEDGKVVERTRIERPPDPRLALEWLARRCPERWNPRQRVRVEHASIRDALAALDLSALSQSELAEIEAILDLIGERA